jgi:hypothetical protein
MHNKILTAAKRLKTFTFDDIVMMTDIEETIIKSALREFTKNNKIKHAGKYFEYIETPKNVENVKIINKSIEVKNSDITMLEAVKTFLQNCKGKGLSFETLKTYKTFLNAHIIPYFYKFLLMDIKIEDVEDFKKYLQEKKISERRIKNILTLLNQVIKFFQSEGYIERTCVFEIKRLKKIPKREIQILTPKHVQQLFLIIKSEYKHLLPIVQKSINEKMNLSDILQDGFYQRKHITKRKIRTDFFKIKQKLNLDNYVFDDLRFSGKTAKI